MGICISRARMCSAPRVWALMKQHVLRHHLLLNLGALPRQDTTRLLQGIEELDLDKVVTRLKFDFAQVFLHIVQATVIHHLRAVNEQS